MVECPELTTYETGEIERILTIHGQNMEKAGICRARHNALVNYLKGFRTINDDDKGQ